MTKRFIHFALCSAFILPLISFSPAGAQDKPAAKEAEAASEQEVIESISDEVNEQMKKAVAEREEATKETFELLTVMSDKLSERERQHFFLTYTNYNLLKTVEVVEKDVGNAIRECGNNNPEMKDQLEARFKDWKSALTPVMKEAKGNLDNMVLAQDYASKADMNKVFASLDNTREKTNNSIQKVPVTSPEACEYLMNKMDETQESMNSLLRTTLVTFPQAFPTGDLKAVDVPAPKSEKQADEASNKDSDQDSEN